MEYYEITITLQLALTKFEITTSDAKSNDIVGQVAKFIFTKKKKENAKFHNVFFLSKIWTQKVQTLT